MKANQDPQKDRELTQVLKHWGVDNPLPPRFQEQVWQRIARTQPTTETTLGFWALVRHLIEINLLRPKFAYSYLAVLVLLGVVSGAWAAQRQANRLNSDLGSRYVQSINPYHQVGSGE